MSEVGKDTKQPIELKGRKGNEAIKRRLIEICHQILHLIEFLSELTTSKNTREFRLRINPTIAAVFKIK